MPRSLRYLLGFLPPLRAIRTRLLARAIAALSACSRAARTRSRSSSVHSEWPLPTAPRSLSQPHTSHCAAKQCTKGEPLSPRSTETLSLDPQIGQPYRTEDFQYSGSPPSTSTTGAMWSSSALVFTLARCILEVVAVAIGVSPYWAWWGLPRLAVCVCPFSLIDARQARRIGPVSLSPGQSASHANRRFGLGIAEEPRPRPGVQPVADLGLSPRHSCCCPRPDDEGPRKLVPPHHLPQRWIGAADDPKNLWFVQQTI